MPDQPTDTNKNAIRVALGAALGSALGIITAARTLSAAKRAEGSSSPMQRTAERNEGRASDLRAGSEEVEAPAQTVSAAPAQRSYRPEGTRSPQPFPTHPDWELLPAAHLPRPTYWPVVLALGIIFLAWGIVTTVAISAVGLLLLALGLGGWIGELRHGH